MRGGPGASSARPKANSLIPAPATTTPPLLAHDILLTFLALAFHNHSSFFHYISDYFSLSHFRHKTFNRHHRPHSKHEARFSRHPFARHISDRIPASPEPEKRGNTRCSAQIRPAKLPQSQLPPCSVCLVHPSPLPPPHSSTLPSPLLHHAEATLHPFCLLTSNPISPVVRATGPTNQTWSIHGTIRPNAHMHAASAAIPGGSLCGESHADRSYADHTLRLVGGDDVVYAS